MGQSVGKLKIPAGLRWLVGLLRLLCLAARGLNPRLAATAKTHHLLLLGLCHGEPVETLFPIAQAALAVALVVHFAYPDTGAL